MLYPPPQEISMNQHLISDAYMPSVLKRNNMTRIKSGMCFAGIFSKISFHREALLWI